MYFVYCKTRSGKLFPQKWETLDKPARTETPLQTHELDEEMSKLSLLRLSQEFPYIQPAKEEVAITNLYS